MQVKPVPRGSGKGGGEADAGAGDYQKFVKENFKVLKGENPGLGLGEVMALVARRYQERKVASGVSLGGSKEGSKESSRGGSRETSTSLEGTPDPPPPGLEDVARKLDFLSLKQ